MNRLLTRQLELIYQHILFHVTAPALAHVFATNPGYDLSTLLGGTRNEVLGLIKHTHYHLDLALGATPVLRLSAASRLKITSLLETCCKSVAHIGLILSTDGKLLATHTPMQSAFYLLFVYFAARFGVVQLTCLFLILEQTRASAFASLLPTFSSSPTFPNTRRSFATMLEPGLLFASQDITNLVIFKPTAPLWALPPCFSS